MSATPRRFDDIEDWELKKYDSEAEFHAARMEAHEKKYEMLSIPILTRDELFEREDPPFALMDYIQEGGLTILHGAPGSGKSLVAMDWAYTLAHDEMDGWMGKPRNKQYRPMYLFTEGLSGLKKRTLAWEAEHGLRAPDIVFVPDSVPLNPPDPTQGLGKQLSSLRKLYLDEGCNLLIVDTLTNTFFGNENQQQDANSYLRTVREFQKQGPVILVHHNRKDEDSYRGSTVFHGAVDTMVSLTMDQWGMADIVIKKQKDGDPIKGSMTLKLKQHEIYDDSERTSVVFTMADNRLQPRQRRVTKKESDLIDIITAAGGEMAVADLATEHGYNRGNLTRDIGKYESLELISDGGNTPAVVRVVQGEEEPDQL